MDTIYYISGNIKEDLNEAVGILADKLNVDRPGGPQAFFTLCKRQELKFEMDYGSNTFTVWYELPEIQEDIVTNEEDAIETPVEEEDDDFFDI